MPSRIDVDILGESSTSGTKVCYVLRTRDVEGQLDSDIRVGVGPELMILEHLGPPVGEIRSKLAVLRPDSSIEALGVNEELDGERLLPESPEGRVHQLVSLEKAIGFSPRNGGPSQG